MKYCGGSQHLTPFPSRRVYSSMQQLLPEELQVRGRVNLSKLSRYVVGLSVGSRHRTLSLFVRLHPPFPQHTPSAQTTMLLSLFLFPNNQRVPVG
jgi:hypothetical protein